MDQDKFSLFSDNELDSLVLPESALSEQVINWLIGLYDLTDWRCVIIDEKIDSEYDGISVISYFKALALPYLINIPPSERALGRIILQRDNLQKLCGFQCGYPVGKNEGTEYIRSRLGQRTFWHFRNKYKEIYPELLSKVLISLVLSGKKPDFSLPFVERITEYDFNNYGINVDWKIDEYRPSVTISLPAIEKDESEDHEREILEEWESSWKKRFINCGNLDEYRALVREYQRERRTQIQKKRRGFTEEMTFPIDVSTTLHSGEKIYFRLNSPNWLEKKSTNRTFISDSASSIVAPKTIYDKACNILVIREENGQREILLTRRRTEGTGEGSFAAPGGKQKDYETLEECAVRELHEETGLKIKSSRPVSLYYTLKEFAGHKQIMSVGVLVEAWEGKVETKEPRKHVGWEWHSLKNLPLPLFEFTKIAIDQYIENKYPNLSWDDVEEKPDTQLELF
jgi:8-oxo-dGTP diphosphatase